VQWIPAPRFRGDRPRGNDGHTGSKGVCEAHSPSLYTAEVFMRIPYDFGPEASA
jgi:hypothetical protein